MTQEQKAKAYDEAIAKAQKELQTCGSTDCDAARQIYRFFSELKESEDERIRRELIAHFRNNSVSESWSGLNVKKVLAWLEKQGQEKHLSEPIKDYQGSFTCWNNAHDFRPKHLQRCICYDKYMGGVYCYVYDDISKYWCTQTTEEHDSDGDNHISDYADYRITLWMPLPDTSFYPSKSLLEKQGEQKCIPKYKIGDYVKNTNYKGEPIYEIIYMDKECYICEYRGKERMGDKAVMHFSFDNPYLRLVQKPADKVEPKFHEGEWIIDKQGIVHQIANVVENVTNHTYGYNVVGDGYFNDNTEGVRLWTIKDAKDGDVLASGHLVFIFKVIHGVWLNCHCSAHNDGSFFADSYDLMTNKYFSEVHPATKEQCDLLFQKMKEAGYEWDTYKKELKKIEEKPKWTDEDEHHLMMCLECVEECAFQDREDFSKTIDWLKSLKYRYNWEPSEEHIHWLKWAINRMPDTEKANEAEAVLEDLLEQLKKLKG